MPTVTLATLNNMRTELVKSKYYLNIRSGYMAPVTLHCSYGDSGETITFYIFDGGDELDLTGGSASLHGTRRDGANFGPIACTIDGNAISFSLASEMTAVEGGGIAEFTISKSGATIGTCNFGIMVEDAVFPNGVAYDSDPSVYQDILKYVQSQSSVLTYDYVNRINNEASARASGDLTNSNAISVERARIDNLVTSETVDQELIDIRVKADGTTSTSAGAAVREQITELRNTLGIKYSSSTAYTTGSGGSIAESRTRVSVGISAGDVIYASISGAGVKSNTTINLYTTTNGSNYTFVLQSSTTSIEYVATASCVGYSLYIGNCNASSEVTIFTRVSGVGSIDYMNDKVDYLINKDELSDITNGIEDTLVVNKTNTSSSITTTSTKMDYSAKRGDTIRVNITGAAIVGSIYMYVYYSSDSGTAVRIDKTFAAGVDKVVELSEDIVAVSFYVTSATSGNYTIRIQKTALSYPAYYTRHVYYVYNRINTLMDACASNGDLFAFITDEHWTLNQKHSPGILKHLQKNCNLVRVFNGGDAADTDPTPFITDLRSNYTGKVYSIVGNHEWFANAGNKFWNRLSIYNDDLVVGDAYYNYYYVDNNTSKIRYIMLNSFRYSDSGSGTPVGDDSTEQLSWFTNTALNVPSGWGVIIFGHYFNPYTFTPCFQYLTAADTAKQNGVDVISFICGHTHFDAVWHTTGGIPIVVTTCDKNKPYINSGGTDTEPWLTSNRIAGTISEQAFDVFVLDRTNRLLTAVRVGASAMNNVDLNYEDSGFSYEGTLSERYIHY